MRNSERGSAVCSAEYECATKAPSMTLVQSIMHKARAAPKERELCLSVGDGSIVYYQEPARVSTSVDWGMGEVMSGRNTVISQSQKMSLQTRTDRSEQDIVEPLFPRSEKSVTGVESVVVAPDDLSEREMLVKPLVSTEDSVTGLEGAVLDTDMREAETNVCPPVVMIEGIAECISHHLLEAAAMREKLKWGIEREVEEGEKDVEDDEWGDEVKEVKGVEEERENVDGGEKLDEEMKGEEEIVEEEEVGEKKVEGNADEDRRNILKNHIERSLRMRCVRDPNGLGSSSMLTKRVLDCIDDLDKDSVSPLAHVRSTLTTAEKQEESDAPDVSERMSKKRRVMVVSPQGLEQIDGKETSFGEWLMAGLRWGRQKLGLSSADATVKEDEKTGLEKFGVEEREVGGEVEGELESEDGEVEGERGGERKLTAERARGVKFEVADEEYRRNFWNDFIVLSPRQIYLRDHNGLGSPSRPTRRVLYFDDLEEDSVSPLVNASGTPIRTEKRKETDVHDSREPMSKKRRVLADSLQGSEEGVGRKTSVGEWLMAGLRWGREKLGLLPVDATSEEDGETALDELDGVEEEVEGELEEVEFKERINWADGSYDQFSPRQQYLRRQLGLPSIKEEA
jgi:hypothetical protein